MDAGSGAESGAAVTGVSARNRVRRHRRVTAFLALTSLIMPVVWFWFVMSSGASSSVGLVVALSVLVIWSGCVIAVLWFLRPGAVSSADGSEPDVSEEARCSGCGGVIFDIPESDGAWLDAVAREQAEGEDPDAIYEVCDVCGWPTESESITPDRCRGCGYRLIEGTDQCPECGRAVGRELPPSPPRKRPVPNGPRPRSLQCDVIRAVAVLSLLIPATRLAEDLRRAFDVNARNLYSLQERYEYWGSGMVFLLWLLAVAAVILLVRPRRTVNPEDQDA